MLAFFDFNIVIFFSFYSFLLDFTFLFFSESGGVLTDSNIEIALVEKRRFVKKAVQGVAPWPIQLSF